MAAGWITQINNYSDSDFSISTNDWTWRPRVIGDRQYQVDEAIAIPAQQAPGLPTTLQVQYMMIGWIDWAGTTIRGPSGFVFATIGPLPPSGNDFLRFFDSQQTEIGSVEIGPRGSGWVASVDFHLNIYNPTPRAGDPPQAAGIKFVWWSQQGVGAEILRRIDQHIGAISNAAADQLGRNLINRLFGV